VTNFVLVDGEGYLGKYLKKGLKSVDLDGLSCLYGIFCSWVEASV